MFEDLTDYERGRRVRDVLKELFVDANIEQDVAWDEGNRDNYDLWQATAGAYCTALSLLDQAFPPEED